MKKLLILPFLLLLSAVVQGQERIANFEVQLHIDSSNTMIVQEQISIIAEGEIFKRGIFRKIPYYRTDATGKSFSNPIKVLSVLQDGKAAMYKDNAKSGELEIRIGDADLLLTHGVHSYIITYEIKNQVGFFETYDEIYWNVTGSQWGLPIDNASCEVILPDGAKQLQTSCYTGYSGSKSQNCIVRM